MVLSWKVGTIAKSGTTTPLPVTQAIQNIGFAPKALLLFAHGATGAQAALTSILRPGFGMSTGPGQNRSLSWGSDTGQDMTAPGGTNAFRRASEEYCFMLASGASGGYPKIKVSSFATTNGGEAILSYDQNDASTYNLDYIAIGGADVVKAKIGSFNLTTSAGNLDIGARDRTRMIWQTTRSGALQRDLANSVLDSNDYIVFHLGVGTTMTQANIDAMNAVTTIPASQKGIECFSLADISANIATVVAEGWGFVCYDLEGTTGNGPSPDAELADPIGSFETARQTVVVTNGKALHSAASNAITSNDTNVNGIAPKISWWHLQSQPKQGDDSTGVIMDDWITDRITLIKSVNSSCIVTYQVSLSGEIAPGDLDEFTTARRCVNLTSSSNASNSPDGLGIWWDAANWDNGNYASLLGYHETKFGGIAFSPDIVLFFGANIAPQIGSGTFASDPHAIWFLGAASVVPNNSVVVAGTSLDAISGSGAPFPNHAARYQRAGSGAPCISIFADNSVTTPLWAEASFVGALTNGFRINVTTPPASSAEAAARPIFYMAIKGGSWNVGSFTGFATTGGTQTVTGTPAIGSYTPKGVLLFSDLDIPRTTISTSGQRFSIGSADATPTQFEQIGGDDNTPAGNVTETIRGRETSSIFRSANETAAPAAGTDVTSRAVFSSFASGNFALNWTLVDANARQLLFVTGGDAPAGAALVKIPTTDTVTITDTPLRRRGSRRTPTSDSVTITEAVLRLRGIVRVVGGFAGLGGFTPEGFISTGFLTTTATAGATADFVLADFVDTDYRTADEAAPAPEQVTITETVVKKLTLASAEFVTASDLVLLYSGGSTYDGSTNGAINSIGGAVSNVPVASGGMRSAWDNVTGSEASTSDDEYRLFYLKNNHGSLTAYDVRMWIQTNTPGGDSIEIAVGAAAPNSVESAVFDENTAPPAPVSFSTAPDENGAIDLGDIPSGQFRSFWIKRHVPANTTSFVDNSYSLRISLVSSHA